MRAFHIFQLEITDHISLRRLRQEESRFNGLSSHEDRLVVMAKEVGVDGVFVVEMSKVVHALSMSREKVTEVKEGECHWRPRTETWGQGFGPAVESPIRKPGFDSRVLLLTPASCLYRLWEAMVLDQIVFLLST